MKLTKTELEAIKSRAAEFHSSPIEDIPGLAADLDIDLTAIEAPGPTMGTAPAPSPSAPSVKISLRVPARTLAAFRAQAAREGHGRYQSLVVKTLKAQAHRWERGLE